MRSGDRATGARGNAHFPAALATAAAGTSSLRLGTLVFDCDFRHPAVLARELATLDLLSEGRLEVGLGAGWKTTNYLASGIAMDPPGDRVDRMIEHAEVLRGLFSGEPFTYTGKHYTIDGLAGTPAPHQVGGPPLLMGGGGRRVLTHAGSVADIVGVNGQVLSGNWDTDSALDSLPSAFDRKLAWVREGAGDRFDDLELSCWLAAAQITDEPDVLAEGIAAMFGVVDTDPAELLASPLTLLGSLAEMQERLIERRERWGLSYVVVPGDQAEELAPLVAELTGT